MFEKIRDLWKRAVGYINVHVPKGNAKPSMKVVYGYAIGFLILFCVVLTAWVIEFCKGSANTMTLIKFFEDYTAVRLLERLHLSPSIWWIKTATADRML